MKQRHLPTKVEAYLDRTLSSSVFSWRQITDLIVPGVLDSLSIMFINMLITALISKNGETSVAAVSLVGPITGLVVCAFQGLSDGGSVIVAQCCGKGDPKLLRRAIGMTIWMTVLIGSVLCLPFLLFPEQLLNLLYTSSDIELMTKATMYLSGCAWSILPFTLFAAIFRILRGLGESKRCLVLTIIINVGYLLFCILFLNVLEMDIWGSVIALFLARMVGAAAAVVALFIWKPPVRMKFTQLFTFDRVILQSTVKVGIPFSLEQICINCGALVSQMYMTKLGTTAIATQAITNSLMGLLYSPAMSVGTLAVTVVGRCVGAGKHDEAYYYGHKCNQIALLLLIVASIIFYPLLPLLLQQYRPSAEAARMATMLCYASIPFLLLFWPRSNTLPSTLRAASDSAYPTTVSLCVLWIINIGLGYVLSIQCGLGLWGIWMATWASWILRSLFFHLRFRSKKWLYMSTLKAEVKN